MLVSDFDFDLPEARIALRPANPRESARLLVVRPPEGLEDLTVGDLPSLLQPGDALVFNDTRVIPARLFGVRRREETEVRVEAILHRRLAPNRWTAFARPGKRLKVGDRILFGHKEDRACALTTVAADVVDKGEGGELTLAFELSGVDLDLAVAGVGEMPLPPYIAAKRPEDEQD
ncbi:MAG: tRNA preQ1(34) S-adenosylmethionine ribosyltransferase-isomerase QueA, partial [Caulobacteraceae bacterium]